MTTPNQPGPLPVDPKPRLWSYFRNGRVYGVSRTVDNGDGSGGIVPRVFVTAGSNISEGCRYIMVYWHISRRTTFTLEAFYKLRLPRVGMMRRGKISLPPDADDSPKAQL